LPRLFQNFHPSPRPYVTYCNKATLYGEELLAPHPTPKLENTPCWKCRSAYPIHSQLSSISKEHFLHPEAKDRPCFDDSDPHNME